MAINKFVDRQGNTLLDLSADSVTSANFVLAGKTYHGPDGLQHTGTLNPGSLDYSQYNFIDYDGTLLYSYTDEQLDALTALPAGPDHTADNLTFQSWNWTLADLKSWDRTRADRPLVGAHYITTDGKSYLYLDTPYAGATLSFETNGKINSVDWGDGNVSTDASNTHGYTNPGQYVIVIDMAEGGYWYFGSNQPSNTTNKQWIKKIKLGNVTGIQLFYCYSLQSISIPNNIDIKSQGFYNCNSLKSIIIPNIMTRIGVDMFRDCNFLQNVSIPNSITEIESNSFRLCYSLKGISLPDSITSIGSNSFSTCTSLQNVSIPNSMTSLGNSVFYECYALQNILIPDNITTMGGSTFNYSNGLTLDLSKQTKVITLTSGAGLDSKYNKILVPSALLSDYKSAPYWTNYAASMVGV